MAHIGDLIVSQIKTMDNNLNNFRSWYSNILHDLYSKQDAGFIILMISFPLLERYLREKSGVHEGNLTDSFYSELQMFKIRI